MKVGIFHIWVVAHRCHLALQFLRSVLAKLTIADLVCLLDLNKYGQQIADLEQLERKEWRSYRIFPMAANVQFVFYRRDTNDSDIVFKVLLNEDEATLPLKTDMAPYYHWNDFKKYYLALLDSFGEPWK